MGSLSLLAPAVRDLLVAAIADVSVVSGVLVAPKDLPIMCQ